MNMNVMKEPLISIIIPVYNGEKYIERCLNSVLTQDFQEYEAIIVNDGSKDHSLEICQNFAEKCEKFRIFSTENSGVSHARNYGMKRARGNWILFLDSDDDLLEGSLQLLKDHLRDDVQEICGNFVTKTEDRKLLRSQSGKVKAEAVIPMILDPVNQHTLPEFYHLEPATLLGIWGKLFLREIIEKNDLYFDEKLKLSEDMIFHIQYLKKIKNVLLLNDAIFCYRENETSVTKNFKEEYVNNRFYLFEQLEQYQMKDAVFVMSTLLQMCGQIEKFSSGSDRKRLEAKVKSFLKGNKKLLSETKAKKISAGRWQNIVYKICIQLFLLNLDGPAFLFLRLYEKVR